MNSRSTWKVFEFKSTRSDVGSMQRTVKDSRRVFLAEGEVVQFDTSTHPARMITNAPEYIVRRMAYAAGHAMPRLVHSSREKPELMQATRAHYARERGE